MQASFAELKYLILFTNLGGEKVLLSRSKKIEVEIVLIFL